MRPLALLLVLSTALLSACATVAGDEMDRRHLRERAHAAVERFREADPSPQTPWPAVQPFPMRVPMPTRTPPPRPRRPNPKGVPKAATAEPRTSRPNSEASPDG